MALDTATVPLDGLYPTLRDSWIGGTSALPLAPEEWQPIIQAGTPEESERHLVALAGQLLTVAFRPHPSSETQVRPELPVLDKPTMPDSYRPLFRTVAKQEWGPAGQPGWGPLFLWLVDARGFSAHPLDWFPSASADSFPQTYLPWQDWARGFVRAATPSVLDDETWAYTSPGDRLVMLKAMRAADPDRALHLIADHAGQESAEPRLKLVEVLQTNLNPADADYLSSLSSDRSGKVRELATKLLSRLGIGTQPSDDLSELAGFITVSHEGFFKKKLSVSPSPLKNNAQAQRRRELFRRCSLADLAKTLGLTPDSLVAAWELPRGSAKGSPADRVGEAELAQMTADTGTDGQVDTLALRLLPVRLDAAMLLQPRASRSVRSQAMTAILASEPINLHFLSTLEPDLAGPADILRSKAFTALTAKTGEPRRPSLLPLAMVATPAAAAAAIDALVAAGVRPQDPWLAPLRLNCSLAQAKES